MKAYKIALCLPLVGFIPLSAQANEPGPGAYAAPVKKKPRHHQAVRRIYVPDPNAQVIPVAAPAPVYAPRPYSWSGFYVGVYGGVSGDANNPQLGVPTYGTLQGNDIGFAPSALNNSYGVMSQPYNALANGTNSNAGALGTLNGPFGTGYTTYTATGSSQSYANTAPVTLFGVTTSNNGLVNNGASSANVTPYNNLPGNRTDSQLSTTNESRRLLATIGGEIGYRHQFGMFVLGVEADGGYIDGKRTQSSNTTGQFSNSQGANITATAAECTSGNGGNPAGCGSALTNSSNGSVNVANNGNSSFSQSITAGPNWLGTARVSGGVAVDRVLLYATGGLAYGQGSIAAAATYRDTANSVCSGNATSPTAGSVGGFTSVGYSCNGVANTGSSFTYSDSASWSGNYSKMMVGYAIGTGAAYAMTDNLILKLEGYYYNLGTLNTTLNGVGSQTLTVNSGAGPIGSTPGTRVASVSSYTVSRKIDGFVAKVGLSLKFDTGTPEPVYPVIAKY